MARMAYLSLGSNLGDRERNIAAALAELRAFRPGLRASSLYRTAPLGVEGQGEYLNCAACLDFEDDPLGLLRRCQAIEASLGRDRAKEGRWGARTIDIDLLVVGALVLDAPGLTLPHPRMTEREFVLVPLLELEPELADPATGRPLAAFLDRARGQGVYYHSPPPPA